MTDERKLLSQKLKEFRKENKLNQFEFADDCGISQRALSLMECQKGNITLDTIQLLASYMGITVSDLFSHTPITYFVIPNQANLEDSTYTTYGIGSMHNNLMIAQIPDVTTDFNKIKSLVLTCNENDLSLIHLFDIIEDFITENALL